MSSFDDRESAFENRFAHDQEMLFKQEARACRAFGLWIAEQLGLSGADADAYAGTVIAANIEEPGFDDVKRKVMPDIEAKGLDVTEADIDAALIRFMAEAAESLLGK